MYLATRIKQNINTQASENKTNAVAATTSLVIQIWPVAVDMINY